mmetsp:Transcript_38113/g.74863  ORF Transcript_38113/g.74863 Transcript_38113/m.74863 type:complete len:130 (-) Transcript_38113:352-741(-)
MRLFPRGDANYMSETLACSLSFVPQLACSLACMCLFPRGDADCTSETLAYLDLRGRRGYGEEAKKPLEACQAYRPSSCCSLMCLLTSKTAFLLTLSGPKENSTATDREKWWRKGIQHAARASTGRCFDL